MSLFKVDPFISTSSKEYQEILLELTKSLEDLQTEVDLTEAEVQALKNENEDV